MDIFAVRNVLIKNFQNGRTTRPELNTQLAIWAWHYNKWQRQVNNLVKQHLQNYAPNSSNSTRR